MLHPLCITATAVKDINTPYPLIDSDPHFRRVIKYFRPSDYAAWAGSAAAFPGGLYLMELFDTTRPKKGLGPALRLSTFLGAAGGFLLAYQRSSFRLWGWSENEIEQSLASKELEVAKAGGPLPAGYGQSDLSDYIQGVAHRNSAFSQLKFSAMPWFNFSNHKHHGPSTADFSMAREGEGKEDA
ncbi:hypothetical protein K437DRAFT_258315 [Tilletiaria anomala UBC 951]|uniref:NADH-ubiquinone oxidoreductase 21 kDa subunit n=1 Tax=Tilletiaria anomala (strain ATCC 24038 / CBS 436.72 / UBC 951) TaxID=1037660 RepID=A0A066VHY1_TILAU|nr:uncharacterized protein K437DRAFT_258315 [Tilletiaria anomala UBC 951]KDN41327.1 hypothetical protein K437DRAFT_258315 [Tilletiaria anomala UBC 951]